MHTQPFIRCIVLLFALGLSANTPAHTTGSEFTEALISADLIFKGEVIDVSYRNSTPLHERNPALAHTFVTFRIDHIFRGSIIGSDDTRDGSTPGETPATITLRFLGGAAGNDEYEFMFGTPLFDVGDRDVLMVTGNGRSICPLVRCVHGRYRIIDRFMYGDDGQEIVETSEASVRYGKFHRLRDVIINQVGSTQVARVGEVEINETGLPQPLADFGTHHDITTFSHVIEHELAELEAAGLLHPPDPIHSQDINVAFSVDLASPVQRLPAIEAENNPADTGLLIADRIEQILLTRNNGDPVLNERQSEFLNRFRTFELKRLNRKELRDDRKAERRAQKNNRRRAQ